MPAVGDGEPEFFCSLFEGSPGERFDGTVLLRWTPPVGVVANAGLAGLGAPLDCLECREETDTLRRMPPYFRTLSAPALAFEEDLAIALELTGVLGVPIGGVPPFCTSCTVFSSAAVPRIPIRK